MNYIFDMDGTLIDSMPAYAGAMMKFLTDHKLSYPDDVIKIITPLGFDGSALYFIELGSDMAVDDIKEELKNNMLDAYMNTIPLKSHVEETVKRLKSEGHSVNVLTASPHVTLDPCLKRLGIFDVFDNVWSCDDFGMTKAETAIYEEAARRLGVGVSDCIFLDDNFNAVATAKKAGMHVIGVYDESSEDYVNDMKAISEKYIYTFGEI